MVPSIIGSDPRPTLPQSADYHQNRTSMASKSVLAGSQGARKSAKSAPSKPKCIYSILVVPWDRTPGADTVLDHARSTRRMFTSIEEAVQYVEKFHLTLLREKREDETYAECMERLFKGGKYTGTAVELYWREQYGDGWGDYWEYDDEQLNDVMENYEHREKREANNPNRAAKRMSRQVREVKSNLKRNEDSYDYEGYSGMQSSYIRMERNRLGDIDDEESEEEESLDESDYSDEETSD